MNATPATSGGAPRTSALDIEPLNGIRRVAFHRNTFDNHARIADLAWPDLVKQLGQRWHGADKEKAPAFAPAIYREGLNHFEERKKGKIVREWDAEAGSGQIQRLDVNVHGWSLLVLDLEGEGFTAERLEQLVDELGTRGLAHIAYSTFSHRPEAPRARLVLRPNRTIRPDEIETVRKGAVAEFGLFADPTCKNPSRIFYLASAPLDTPESATFFASADGSDVDVDALIRKAPPPPVPTRPAVADTPRAARPSTPAIDRARRYAEACPPAVEGQNGDPATFTLCAAIARGFDLSDDDALEALRPWNARCLPPWDEADLLRKIGNARAYGDEPVGGRLEQPTSSVANQPPPPRDDELGRRESELRVPELETTSKPPREPGEDDGDDTAGAQLLRSRVGTQWDRFGTPWPAPKPIVDKLLPVEPLRLEHLPDALGAWVFDIADRMQVPPEFPAGAALVALGSLLTNRCTIRPKRRDTWAADPNIWGAAIGPPGIMKTPAVNEGLSPLRRLAAEAREQHEQDQKTWDAEQEIAEARAAARKKRVKKVVEANDPAEIVKLKAELAVAAAEPQGLPDPHPYLLNDTTAEKLVDMAKQTPRGLFLFRDELSGLFSYLERDGHENDRALYTEAWEPKPYRQDRIGRGTVYVERLGVSLFGTIQPGPLFRHIRGALKNGDAADGFIQRFQLLLYPDVSPTWQNVDRYPDTERKRAAFRLFKALDTIPPSELGAVLDDHEQLPHFRFDEGGQRVFDAWRADLERKVRSLEEPALQGHLAKFRKLFPALALLFELVDRVENARGPGQVGEAAAMLAVEWTRLLEQHAARIYQAATNGDTAGARVLLEKVRAGELKDGFTARDVYRHQWAGLVDRDETDAAIAKLIDAGWLREVLRTSGRGGGRPTETYRINPAVHAPSREGSVCIGGLRGQHSSSSSSLSEKSPGASEAPGTDTTDEAPPFDPATGEVLP